MKTEEYGQYTKSILFSIKETKRIIPEEYTNSERIIYEETFSELLKNLSNN